MSTFDIAHIREQGQDIIIIPLTSSFGSKPTSEQHAIIDELQMGAESAGLAGTVVPVWESGGRMMFIAPRPWHPFFQGLSMFEVSCMINRKLYLS